MTRPRQLNSNNDDRWDFLAGVLPHGIAPTDIDLVIERKGHFLVLEGKRAGATFKLGQRKFYDALHSPPHVIVVHFYGTPPDQVERFAKWGEAPLPGDTEALIGLVRTWFEWVERRPRERRSA
ncbi:MAG: hypothetical protein ACYC6T_08195 [Thermoleophilia bacterium]